MEVLRLAVQTNMGRAGTLDRLGEWRPSSDREGKIAGFGWNREEEGPGLRVWSDKGNVLTLRQSQILCRVPKGRG